MKLEKMKMEDWFIKTSDCDYTFSESGVPDFKLGDFLQKIGSKKINEISLSNNNTWGSLELRKTITDIYKEVNSDEIIVTNGTSEALYIFFNLFLNQNKKVLILGPTFPPLRLIPEALGANVFIFDSLEVRRSNLVNSFCQEIKKVNPDLIIVNTPHNPTGFVLKKEEIKKIGKEAKELKATILFDEHYRFLSLNSDDIFDSGYGIVQKDYERVFAVGSVIKCAGIVGIRVGWLIGAKKFLSKVRDYKDYTTHCTPLFNDFIAREAIENINKITPKFINNIKKNKEQLADSRLVKEGKIKLDYEVEGGCVSFWRCDELAGEEIARELAKEKVSIMPGEAFQKKNYIRVNMSQNNRKFKYLLKCLNKIIK